MRKCFCGHILKPLVQFGKPTMRWWHEHEVQAMTCSNCAYTGFVPPMGEILEEYYSHHYGGNAQSWYNVTADYAQDKVVPRATGVYQLAKQYLPEVADPITLEIGCAFGGTVQALRDRGIKAFGVDLNTTAIAEGRARGNQHVYSKYAQTLMEELGEKANIIYSYHALEHMTDPAEFLVSIKSVLADLAILEFRVPNGTYLKAWMEGFESWEWFAYPDHLHMLTPYSVLHLANTCGYDLLAVTSDTYDESLAGIASWLGFEVTDTILPVFRSVFSKSLMLKELRFLLSAKGSTTSSNHASLIKATQQQCEDNLRVEQDLMNAC